MVKKEAPISISESEMINDPMNFINRELSMLEFHKRVLDEALNPENPLLERVRFLGLLGSILDEFFMVRVGGLAMGAGNKDSEFYFENLLPQEQLRRIRKRTRALFGEALDCYWEMLEPQLAKKGVEILHYEDLTNAQKSRVDAYFNETIFPVLTPLAFDPGHPFPYISNLSFNLAVRVADSSGRRHFARLKVPGSLPYFLPVHKAAYDPSIRSKPVRKFKFVWVSEVIEANLGDLFPGMDVIEAYQFYVVRNAEIEFSGLEVMDMLEMMEESVRRRRLGEVVQLLIGTDMPDDILRILVDNLDVDPQFIYSFEKPIVLRNLLQMYKVDRSDLKSQTFSPVVPEEFQLDHDSPPEQFFNVIRRQDVLLHHPYQSFDPVVEFLRQAAVDPDVLAIKQTLYRVGGDSSIVRALLQARRDYGKQVAVLVELQARFDEENNIEWAKLLEQEGVHVTYGLPGLKTHSKIVLVVRREGEHIRRYVHMATGNYNHVTAQLYEDIGMFTSDDAIGADATDLFNYLTGYSAKENYRKLLVAPLQLREMVRELICREIKQQKQYGDGWIIFKINALVDEEMIKMLYRASQQGVKIDLIVRGICCLRPGIEGLSENIRVVSVVGRFLEHSRIYYFYNHGKEEIFIGSADLMPRNLNQRVEVVFPVENSALIRHIRDDILQIYLQENINAWRMNSDGHYFRAQSKDDEMLIDVQQWFIERKKL